MRPLLLGFLLLAGCTNTQTVFRCRACFLDQPGTCANYEGALD